MQVAAGRAGEGREIDPLAPAHTDWLRHTLGITGPAAEVAAFAAATAGAGVIPWQLPELDRWEEDRLHALLRPPDGTAGLRLASARALARALRDAMEANQARAAARVGAPGAMGLICPLDLHALLPVPAAVLRLGPDDPASCAWLRRHWGVVEKLRHVRAHGAAPDRRLRRAARLGFEFWSADWSPWAALAAIRQRWPALVFELRPDYRDG